MNPEAPSTIDKGDRRKMKIGISCFAVLLISAAVAVAMDQIPLPSPPPSSGDRYGGGGRTGGNLAPVSGVWPDVSSLQGVCGIVSPLIKVRPFDSPAALKPGRLSTPTYKFSAARNEYESFQVVCLGPLDGISISITGAAGLEYQLHSVQNVLLNEASDCKGASGLFPDIIVPFKDVFYGQDRTRITSVPGMQSRAFWIDFFVPPELAASVKEITGSVVVAATGVTSFSLPFSLAVRSFALPDVSPYITAFGFTGFAAEDNDWKANAIRHADLALMHRVTTSNFMAYASELYGSNPDYNAYKTNWGSYITGKRMQFGLRSAKITSMALINPYYCWNFYGNACGASNVQNTINNWRLLSAYFKSQGWQDLLFDYTQDEPSTAAQYNEINARRAAVKAADPSLRTMVTTSPSTASSGGFSGSVDIYCPVINFVAVKGTCASPNGHRYFLPEYRNLPKSQRWIYQSCMSHGCHDGTNAQCRPVADPTGDNNGYSNCLQAWPSYMVDHSAVSNRIMPWATYLMNFGGELYWSMTYPAYAGLDDWAPGKIFAFGGNGDGSLVYRGRLSKIGGTKEIPLASFRMKAIRDGQEDLMYMALAEAKVGRGPVEDVIGTIMAAPYSFLDNDIAMMQARDALAALIEAN